MYMGKKISLPKTARQITVSLFIYVSILRAIFPFFFPPLSILLYYSACMFLMVNYTRRWFMWTQCIIRIISGYYCVLLVRYPFPPEIRERKLNCCWIQEKRDFFHRKRGITYKSTDFAMFVQEASSDWIFFLSEKINLSCFSLKIFSIHRTYYICILNITKSYICWNF